MSRLNRHRALIIIMLCSVLGNCADKRATSEQGSSNITEEELELLDTPVEVYGSGP